MCVGCEEEEAIANKSEHVSRDDRVRSWVSQTRCQSASVRRSRTEFNDRVDVDGWDGHIMCHTTYDIGLP